MVAALIADAGFDGSVTVSCTDTHAILTSDTYPDHERITGIIGTNEQVPVPADYAAPILLAPKLGNAPLTRDAALGVAVDGMPIYDYTGGGEMSLTDLVHQQALHDTVQTGQLDACSGHAKRGDDYHHHTKPVCMIEQMANAGAAAVIGWAFDGFPIYGDTIPDGSTVVEGALGLCNGQPDDQFGYRYLTSAAAPYIFQRLMGEVVNIDRLPRVSPLVAANGGNVAPGRLPKGGVIGLVFSEDADGARSMDYSYDGKDYFIRYAPTETAGCYAYETRTVTNGGALQTDEFCRNVEP